MKMKFPELIACRNTTYIQALLAERDYFRRLAQCSYGTCLMAAEKYRELDKELKRIKEDENEHTPKS